MHDPYQEMSDLELILLVANGTPQKERAFTVLYNRYWPRLLGVVCRFLGDQSTAEDIVEEVLIGLWEQARKFDPNYQNKGNRTTPWAWLKRCALHRAIDHGRREASAHKRFKKMLEQGLFLEEEPLRSNPTEEELADLRKDRLAALRDCLERLRQTHPQWLEVCVLLYCDDCTIEEVAELLDSPKGTVQAQSGRSRAALRECLEKKGITL